MGYFPCTTYRHKLLSCINHRVELVAVKDAYGDSSFKDIDRLYENIFSLCRQTFETRFASFNEDVFKNMAWIDPRNWEKDDSTTYRNNIIDYLYKHLLGKEQHDYLYKHLLLMLGSTKQKFSTSGNDTDFL